MGLDDEINKEEMLDVFRVDPQFEQVRLGTSVDGEGWIETDGLTDVTSIS